MARIAANGIELEYEVRGPEDGAPMVLIMGLGSQMTRWPAPFLDGLVARGYRVVRFDNRDIGLSTHFNEAGPADFGSVVKAVGEGRQPDLAFTLDDMAADTVGLMDALGIEAAHVLGVSMGGMIAQLVATDHPGRALSLTSIMSTTGHPSLDRATPEAQAALANRPPDPKEDREAYLDNLVATRAAIGSPAYPTDPDELRALGAADLDRSYHPQGFGRQYAAILGAPHRRDKLAKLTIPALVIHGDKDPLVPLSGGQDTAASIPGARLEVFEGMGHDLPKPLIEPMLDLIAQTAR